MVAQKRIKQRSKGESPCMKITDERSTNQFINIIYFWMKLFLKIFLGIVTLLLLLIFLTNVVIEPWIGKKISTEFNEKHPEYKLEIDKVHLLLFASGIELKNIKLVSNSESDSLLSMNEKIASIQVKGIRIAKAIFKKDIDIREVIISNLSMKRKVPFKKKPRTPKLSTLNIKIGTLLFNRINMQIENTLNAKAFSVKEGVLKVYNLQVEKQDTLSRRIFKQFDFEAEELLSVSNDSMYSYKASGIIYSVTTKTLAVDSFSIHPNYKDYDFTSRHQFETDRIEATLNAISFHDFSAADYFKSRSIVSSSIRIGQLDLNAFRDKRKKFRHVNKPAFQDMIYNYPGHLDIDSIDLISGNVTYIEHAFEANEPGRISFNEINAKIYNLTNDTIYKTESAFFKIKCEAMLMGKSKMTISLKGRLFDKDNTFSVRGTLSGMDASEMNPMLAENAFIYVTSGRIDAMNFGFTANNTKASGKMSFLYHGMDVAVKNKRTDDTTAIKERFKSVIANLKLMNSNPMPGQVAREGIIDTERDPERFLFQYCSKSIQSGIKTSLVKNKRKRKE